MSTLGPQTRQILCDGAEVLIRPIQAEDEKRYAEFFTRVSPEDIRLRFFAPMKHFSRAFIVRMTRPDPRRSMAFIAVDAQTGGMLGVVRLHLHPDGETAEYAIIVRSDLKGKGLGWHLMQTIIDYAQTRGLRTLEGQVLGGNTTMLDMCRELGFALRSDTRDPGVVSVRLDLQAKPDTKPARLV
jgi:acetyltransferase